MLNNTALTDPTDRLHFWVGFILFTLALLLQQKDVGVRKGTDWDSAQI